MRTSDLFFIAAGLSMDAFAVAIAHGALMVRDHGKVRHWGALKIALFFGGFQALMPVLGWLAGWSFRSAIQFYDHWIAFALLGLVGGKMLLESLKADEDKDEKPFADGVWVLLGLAVATSIDALVVGLSFSFLNVEIPFPALFIGAVTFLFSVAGVHIGARLGHFFEKRIELLGGLVLIGIGVKILVEHLSA